MHPPAARIYYTTKNTNNIVVPGRKIPTKTNWENVAQLVHEYSHCAADSAPKPRGGDSQYKHGVCDVGCHELLLEQDFANDSPNRDHKD